MSKHFPATFWFGIVIGVLAMLLVTALAVIFVPRLRPIVALENNQPVLPPAQPLNAFNNVLSNESAEEPTPTPLALTENDNMKVTEPEPNQKIGNPVIIRGEARVFENTVSLRVRDANGDVLAEAFTEANSPDIGEFGPFEISLVYKTPRGTTGTVEVFERSAKDGSEINKIKIPVRFK